MSREVKRVPMDFDRKGWKNGDPFPTEGEGWQMWEMTGESPMSPVFDEPRELARWLADTGASANGDSTATFDEWAAMIDIGWAPSMMGYAGEVVSGVEYCLRRQQATAAARELGG